MIPRGSLSVDSAMVRVGTQSNLTWQIKYPEKVTDIIEVTPITITSKEELKMRVRVLGSKVRTNNGHGNNVDGMDTSNTGNKSGSDLSGAIDDEKKGTSFGDMPVEVVWSKNKSAWSRIFYGSYGTIVPTSIVLDTVIAKSDVVDFGARGYLLDWLPLYCTSTNCSNLVILKNGDSTPLQIASSKQMAGFIKPYLTTDYKKAKIGDNELLILVELDQTEPMAVGFNYQDLGMLVTFE
jgi:hypothetical protein